MTADGEALCPPGYAVVNPSGNVQGPEIKLGDVLQHLKPFKLRAPFIWVVGGLAVHGKTKGDIDILVRAKTGELSDELWEVIKFRVLRALPPELADRVQFHFEDGKSGPFTDNVPLYDIELADAAREVVRMDAQPEPAELIKAVKPAAFFKLMQPATAVDGGERLTLDALKRTLLDCKPFPALVQKRLDGATAEFWKTGARVGAFSADGENLSNSLALAPALVALKQLPHDSLVLVGAVEAWRGTTHLLPDVLANILRSEVGAPKGVKVSATIHDALHLDGDDLTSKGAADRHSVVRRLGLKAPLFVVPSAKADDVDVAAAAVDHMSALPGSGGAVVKAAESAYAPGAEALEVRTAEKGYGLEFYPAYGWVESELFFQDFLNREWDLSQLDYETAMEEATEEGAEELKTDEPADPYMRIPDEGKTWRYVVQEHSRGKSIHSDLRMEIGGGELVGWTLNTQIAGAVKEPVETLAALRALKGHSKIVWPTGEWARRERGDATVNVEIVSERKGTQLGAWRTFEGVTKPGTVGACFAAGVLVLTKARGFTPIESVEVGSLVYTSEGHWRRVTECHVTSPETRQCFQVRGNPGINAVATEDHPFLIAELWYDGKTVGNRIKSISWKTATELFEMFDASKHAREKFLMVVPRTPETSTSESYEEGLLTGFILGDGYLRGDARVELYFNAGKEGRLARYYQHVLKDMGVESYLNRIRVEQKAEKVDAKARVGCLEIAFASKDITKKVAVLKADPSAIHGRSKRFALGVVDGLLDSDGYQNRISQKKPWVRAILSHAILHADRACGVRLDERTGGRTYTISQWGLKTDSSGRFMLKTFSIRKAECPEATYNLSVEDDESYYVPSLIAHNTSNHPGVFDIVDKGEVEYLGQKPKMHEYWFNGKGLKGRYLFRQLERGALAGKGVQRPLNEPSTVNKQFVIAPAEDGAPKDEATWMFIKPVDQTPYVLGSRAVGEGWLPPKGVSALPKALRSKVLKELRYWDMTGAEALDRRRELRKLWLKDDVIKAVDAKPAPVPFVLQFHGFRRRAGASVGEGVSAKHYDLRLDLGEPTIRHWVLARSPLENAETKGWFKRDNSKKSMSAEGVFEPGDPLGLNPTVDTTAFMKRIDKGEAEVIVDDENTFKARFDGKRLKGVWVFARGNSGEWAVARLK